MMLATEACWLGVVEQAVSAVKKLRAINLNRLGMGPVL